MVNEKYNELLNKLNSIGTYSKKDTKKIIQLARELLIKDDELDIDAASDLRRCTGIRLVWINSDNKKRIAVSTNTNAVEFHQI